MPRSYIQQALWEQGKKKCKACQYVFDVSEFWSVGNSISARCKICAASRQRETRKPDRNVKGKRDRARKWRESHPELFKSRIENWNAANPEKSRQRARRRRAKKSENGCFLITENDLKRLVLHQRGLCYLCSLPLNGVKELDHIIPIKLGGRHSIGNVGWTHKKCNRAKHFKLLAEYRYGGLRESSIAIS